MKPGTSETRQYCWSEEKNADEFHASTISYFGSASTIRPRPASIMVRRLSFLPVFRMTWNSLKIPLDDGNKIDCNFLRQRYAAFAMFKSLASTRGRLVAFGFPHSYSSSCKLRQKRFHSIENGLVFVWMEMKACIIWLAYIEKTLCFVAFLNVTQSEHPFSSRNAAQHFFTAAWFLANEMRTFAIIFHQILAHFAVQCDDLLNDFASGFIGWAWNAEIRCVVRFWFAFWCVFNKFARITPTDHFVLLRIYHFCGNR